MTQQSPEFLAAVYAAEGLPLSDAELGRFAGRYARARAAADTMFELAEAKYVEPAAVFTARPHASAAGTGPSAAEPVHALLRKLSSTDLGETAPATAFNADWK